MARANKYTSINFNEIYEKKAATTTGSSTSPATGRYTSLSSAAHPGKSYSFSASSRSHGMLVLSRPSPKPVSHPQPPPPQTQTQTQPQSNPIAQQYHKPQSPHPQPSPRPQPQTPPHTILTDQPRLDSESISLRPLGKTGTGPLISTPPSQLTNPNQVTEKEKELSSPSLPKTDKFVPPHLRPGFAAKEGRPATPPGGGRPKSGGGKDFGGYRQGALGSSPNRYGDDVRPKSGGGKDFGGYRQGALGSSPNRYGDDGRPKSGGGYERTIGRRGAGFGGGGGHGHELGPGEMNRSRSGGYRPGSSG